jgi:hypothetical protein
MRAGLAALLALAAALGACSGGGAGGSSATAAPAADTVTAEDRANCDRAAVRHEAALAMGLSGVRDLINRDDGAVLVVDAATWRSLPYDGQRRVLALIDCAAAGPGMTLAQILVRQDRDGADMMRVTGAELMRWEGEGLSRPVTAAAATSAAATAEAAAAQAPAAAAAGDSDAGNSVPGD